MDHEGLMKDEPEFQRHAIEALEHLHRELASAADEYDFKVELTPGAVTIALRRPAAKVVVRSHPSSGQILVSGASKSRKLDWDAVENTFVVSGSEMTLREVVEEVLSQQLGEDVSL